MMQTLLWIILALAALYLLASFVTFHLVFRRFTSRWNPLKALTNATDALLAPYSGLMDAGREWQQSHPFERVEIRSYDGLRLCARFYRHPAAKTVLVACHGYRSNGERDFASAIRYYGEHDMSILLIDERACGESEGRYMTFGVKEWRDVRDWCAYAETLCPGVPVVLAGISMGAAAVLMAADELPDSVTAILSDCGFCSAREELSYAARHYFTPAAAILLPGVELFCRLLAGFSLGERDARAVLAKTSLPVFFAHGLADELVPPEDSEKNRAACAGPSELFLVPCAEHGMSYLVDHEGYCARVDAFLEKYVFV